MCRLSRTAMVGFKDLERIHAVVWKMMVVKLKSPRAGKDTTGFNNIGLNLILFANFLI